MSDTKRREITKTGRKAEETRARVRESLYKAKASGALTEDDEAELLRLLGGGVAGDGAPAVSPAGPKVRQDELF